MQRGRSDIRKRATGAPSGPKGKKIRIPIKKKTADNILRMNAAVSLAKRELEEAQRELVNHTLPLLTERGLDNAVVIECTEKEPYQLVVVVPR